MYIMQRIQLLSLFLCRSLSAMIRIDIQRIHIDTEGPYSSQIKASYSSDLFPWKMALTYKWNTVKPLNRFLFDHKIHCNKSNKITQINKTQACVTCAIIVEQKSTIDV